MVVDLRELALWSFWSGNFMRFAFVDDARPDILIAADKEPCSDVCQRNALHMMSG